MHEGGEGATDLARALKTIGASLRSALRLMIARLRSAGREDRRHVIEIRASSTNARPNVGDTSPTPARHSVRAPSCARAPLTLEPGSNRLPYRFKQRSKGAEPSQTIPLSMCRLRPVCRVRCVSLARTVHRPHHQLSSQAVGFNGDATCGPQPIQRPTHRTLVQATQPTDRSVGDEHRDRGTATLITKRREHDRSARPEPLHIVWPHSHDR